jgi:hypothetical protein
MMIEAMNPPIWAFLEIHDKGKDENTKMSSPKM